MHVFFTLGSLYDRNSLLHITFITRVVIQRVSVYSGPFSPDGLRKNITGLGNIDVGTDRKLRLSVHTVHLLTNQ